MKTTGAHWKAGDQMVLFWVAAGQTKPTRVIRLLAEDTIERSVLHIQRRKLENGEDAGEAALQVWPQNDRAGMACLMLAGLCNVCTKNAVSFAPF